MMKKTFPALAIFFLFFLPTVATSQRNLRKPAKPAPAAKESLEPLRVASGLMTENRIAVRRSDWINAGAPLFDYTLVGARMAEGRLEFSGSLMAPGKSKAQVVTSTLITTTARSANPWPGATSSTARERRPAGQKPEGEANEQTQSLYSAATDVGLGCELIYLKIVAPMQSEPLQVGVVLAHRDNERGNEINQAICRIVRAMKTGADATELLAKLNHLLSP
jgi:hypothetical protein